MTSTRFKGPSIASAALCFLLAQIAAFGENSRPERFCEVWVDLVEVHHYYDKKGDFGYAQVILWRLHPDDGKFHSYGWRQVTHRSQLPVLQGTTYRIVTNDRSPPIQAGNLKISHSQDDPERRDVVEYWHRVQGQSAPNLFVPIPRKRAVSDE